MKNWDLEGRFVIMAVFASAVLLMIVVAVRTSIIGYRSNFTIKQGDVVGYCDNYIENDDCVLFYDKVMDKEVKMCGNYIINGAK